MSGLRHIGIGTSAGRAALLLLTGLVIALVVGIARPAEAHCQTTGPQTPAAMAFAILKTPAPIPAPRHPGQATPHCHAGGTLSAVALPGDAPELRLPFPAAAAIAYLAPFAAARHVLPDLKPPIG